ncbi:DnaB-like helicase N-terminal domain-containing protein [Streptomyces sp. NPDC019531]|uniref:DnaB-like helicase N-terminal domain-containing protein n=1 Tax=Streptomyces sp. NPDC019531 TaxID=3365062 RepID=UPI00384FB20B
MAADVPRARAALAARLRELRMARGIPLTSFARQASFNASTLSRFETGRIAISDSALRIILHVLDLPPDERAEVLELHRQAATARKNAHRATRAPISWQTREELRDHLAQLRVAAGNPSIRQLAARVPLSKTSISRALQDPTSSWGSVQLAEELAKELTPTERQRFERILIIPLREAHHTRNMSVRQEDTTKPASAASSERVPPQDVEAERSVLGAMLSDEEVITAVASRLDATDFFIAAHETIYTAIKALHSAGQIVDPVTASEELDRRGELDSVGGIRYLFALTSVLPGALAGASANADTVHDCAVRRRVIEASARIAQLAYGESVPAGTLVATAHDLITQAAASGPQRVGSSKMGH